MWTFEHKKTIKTVNPVFLHQSKKASWQHVTAYCLGHHACVNLYVSFVVSCIYFKSTYNMPFQNYLWVSLLLLGLSNAQRSNTNFDFFGSFEQQPQQQRPPQQQQQPRGRVEPDSFDQESKVKTTTPVPILQQINE